MPALPLDEAGKYVAAAYLVFLALLIIYVAIMGMKVTRMEKEIAEILEETERSEAVRPSQDGEQSPQTARQDASPEAEPGRSPGVRPSQDGEQSPQTARQDASPEATSP